MRPAPFRDASGVLDALTQTHRRVGVVPSGDECLRYVLPVPRGWGRVCALAANPAAGRPEILGIFSPQPDLAGPRLIVSATRLRWDVDPLLWTRYHWETAGWRIAAAQPLEARWHPRFEVGALRRVEGEVEVRRGVGFVDNGRLLRVDAVAPSSVWARVHDTLWPSGVLFSLAKPTYRREVEARMRIGNSSLVAFGLPASWRATRVAAPDAGVERWVASPTDDIGRSVALRVEASAWNGETLEPIEARQLRVRHELWQQGIKMARRVERVHAGLAAGTPGLAGVFSVVGRDDEESFEIRLAHRFVDGVLVDYIVVVASPTRFPLDFMRAARALEIAVATTEVRPQEEQEHAA